MESHYLDNAATSFPKAPLVAKEMSRYIDEVGANINRGVYGKATEAALDVLEARDMLRTLFNFGGDASHVVFTPGATFGLNMILKGSLKAGDHVIISSLEHNSVIRPLTELEDSGVAVSRIPANKDGLTKARDILPLLRPNTKLVLVSHASNVSGSIFPLEELADICFKNGVPLAVDAAQTAGHLQIDFDTLKLSALCVPGHKGLLGPQGIGAVLLEKTFAQKLRPLITGGTGSDSDSGRQPHYMPDRFESGTQNIPGIYGLRASLRYILEQGTESLREHEMKLCSRFMEGIAKLPLRIVGPTDITQRVGVVSIDFECLDNAEAAFILEQEYGILTRCGLHCAPEAHMTLGTFPQGTVRFSIGHKTSLEDIDAAVKAVEAICKNN